MDDCPLEDAGGSTFIVAYRLATHGPASRVFGAEVRSIMSGPD